MAEDYISSKPRDADCRREYSLGHLQLYPVIVKTPSGERFVLQVNPSYSVNDIRKFLLGRPETCYFTCYDLQLRTRDGSTHHLQDYNEISEISDISIDGCWLEMVAALYDDTSIRAHVHRTMDLLSIPHASLPTSLALQYELSKASNSEELDGLGLMEDVPGSLVKVFSSSSEEVKFVWNIAFSSFNPDPQSPRRSEGDLIYLDIETLEGKKYCITGNTKGFYANASTRKVLDPRPDTAGYEATTLVGILLQISDKFNEAFREIMEWKATAHPFENVQSLLPPNSWLGLYPVPHHQCCEDGMQRDWNKELQSCRESPHKTPEERILRDKALYKGTSAFVEAAISGAVKVIKRCIPPINPTDPECLHMYAHNNISFSFAVDAEMEQLSKKRFIVGENDRITEMAQGSVETLLVEREQATYASANNELKGTKAYQEADVPGLHYLAMAIIDYRGHRVVAKSVLPERDKSDSMLYGSVDNGKKICWNEDFHSKVLEAAKRLHLKEHKVLDSSGNNFKLAAPVECKGMVGSDDRHYLWNLMRATPRDANFIGPGSRFSILRPELISAFVQEKAQAPDSANSAPKSKGEVNVAADSSKSEGEVITEEDKNKADTEYASASVKSCETHEEILFNPNVFTEFKLAGPPEEIEADEKNVREVTSYLLNAVIPKFIQDLGTLKVTPMDGQTLTEALHAHGINIRYIGKVANQTKLLYPRILCSNEIVVRSAKHIFKDVLRDTEYHDQGPAISHLLNCFFGDCQLVASEMISSRESKDEKNISSYMNISSDSLWSEIRKFAKLKFQSELRFDARLIVKEICVLRNLCNKVGITIAVRKYDFNTAAPFQASDILNLVPVVKHSIPVCSKAKEIIEMGKAQLIKGMHTGAYKFFSKGLSLLEQVTGPMHPEVANCCRYLAMVLYHAGDMAGGLMQQHKEIIINERCLGLDHPNTARSYANMVLFYHAQNQTKLALQHMYGALLLLGLSSGPSHPDVAAKFKDVAMIYQDIGTIYASKKKDSKTKEGKGIREMEMAVRYLQQATTHNGKMLGWDHIRTAACYHALAIVFKCMGKIKLSNQHEKKSYNILLKQMPDFGTVNRPRQQLSSLGLVVQPHGDLRRRRQRKQLSSLGFVIRPARIRDMHVIDINRGASNESIGSRWKKPVFYKKILMALISAILTFFQAAPKTLETLLIILMCSALFLIFYILDLSRFEKENLKYLRSTSEKLVFTRVRTAIVPLAFVQVIISLIQLIVNFTQYRETMSGPWGTGILTGVLSAVVFGVQVLRDFLEIYLDSCKENLELEK